MINARVIAFVMLLIAAPLQSSEAGIRSLQVREPRNFGYFVGDIFERRIELLVDHNDALLPASLPSVGQVTYWLDLLRTDVRESRADDGTLYTITLVYQNFYVPLDAHKLVVPEWPLRVGTDTAIIPTFTFTGAPIRELFPEKSGETADTFLQADAKATPIGLGWLPFGAGLSMAVALFALLALARHHAWWPFRLRPDRPFTRAARMISSLSGDSSDPVYRDALLAMHRAFDATDHRRVLAADIGGFVARHPQFEASRGGIEEFFRNSREIFFGGTSGRYAFLPLQSIKSLAGELARGERAL
jgi:mxaA protein